MGLNVGYLKARRTVESDGVYTPAYAVKPIIKFIPSNSTIWCPFDMQDSEYVLQLCAAGHKVIATHIDNGQNFFDYEPEEDYDFIISNPPFSIKDDILKRLDEIGKSYAMLMPLPVLQGQKRFQYLTNAQALIFDKRINYFKNKETKEILKGVSFASIYLCKNFLSENLMFEVLKTK